MLAIIILRLKAISDHNTKQEQTNFLPSLLPRNTILEGNKISTGANCGFLSDIDCASHVSTLFLLNYYISVSGSVCLKQGCCLAQRACVLFGFFFL